MVTPKGGISIGRESLPSFFCAVGAVAYLQISPLGCSRDETWRGQGIRKRCVLEFAKTESTVTVQRTFRTMYHTEPPTDKIREWHVKFQYSGCVCAVKWKGWPLPACSFHSAQAATLLEFQVPLTNCFVRMRFCVVRGPKPLLHCHNWLSFGKFQDTERFLIPCPHPVSSRLPPSGETCKYATAPSTQKNLGEILYLLICSPSACPFWLLYRRCRNSRKDLWITLYIPWCKSQTMIQNWVFIFKWPFYRLCKMSIVYTILHNNVWNIQWHPILESTQSYILKDFMQYTVKITITLYYIYKLNVSEGIKYTFHNMTLH
jgi:hypothetical protein